jgi:hypothetical protein
MYPQVGLQSPTAFFIDPEGYKQFVLQSEKSIKLR